MSGCGYNGKANLHIYGETGYKSTERIAVRSVQQEMAGRQELYKVTFGTIFNKSKPGTNNKLAGKEVIAAEEAHQREDQDFNSGVINLELYTLSAQHPVTQAPVYCDIWDNDDDFDEPMGDLEYEFRRKYHMDDTVNYDSSTEDDDDDAMNVNLFSKYNYMYDEDDDVIIEEVYYM